jgi:hydrogenase nickel incorporation protein HypA/HybF
MHEYGLCEPIVDAVLLRAGDRPVRGVLIRAGVTHGVDRASLELAFQVLARDTVAQDAVVEVQVTPVTVACHDCGHTGAALDLIAACENCGSDNVRRSGGDELTLVSIAYARAGVFEPEL